MCVCDEEQQKNRYIYIVLSQTGSVVAKTLKKLTHAEYNHVSVSLSVSLRPMYSFARKYPRNPLIGAYVREYPNEGTLSWFKGTEVKVLELPVTESQFAAVQERLETMYEERDRYHYNYRGLFGAFFGKVRPRENYYYCSEFVRDLLEECGIVEKGSIGLQGKYAGVVQPVDFLKIPEAKCIYAGSLNVYAGLPKNRSLLSFVTDPDERDSMDAESVSVHEDNAVCDR